LLKSDPLRVLFICSRNRLRSPTAEQIFSARANIECDSAGLAPDADVLLSTEQVEWAQMIFVMERTHSTKLRRKFKPYLAGKKLVALGIPDDYGFMEPALIKLLEQKVLPFLRCDEET
jgi:predicted protein tyrosine phosphatase